MVAFYGRTENVACFAESSGVQKNLGQRLSRPPQVPVTIDHPGLGRVTAYTVGHPEPITLHERMNVHDSSAKRPLFPQFGLLR